MWILLRIALVLVALWARVSGIKFGSQGFQTLVNGLEVELRNVVRKRKIQKTEIYIKTNQKIFFSLVPENTFLSFCKSVGLGSEIQVGDPEFDNAFYVACDNPAFIYKLRSSVELIDTLKKLSSLGYTRIESRGDGQIKMETKQAIEHIDESLLQLMTQLKTQYDSISLDWSNRNPYAGAFFAVELFSYALTVFSIAGIVEFAAHEAELILNLWQLIKHGLLLGAVVIAVWLLIYSLFLRKSSLGPLMLLESMIGLVLGLSVAFTRILIDVNIGLDKSKPVFVDAGIDQKFIKSSSRGGSIYYLQLNPMPNDYIKQRKLAVSNSTYFRMTEGQGIRMAIKEGYLGAPYIVEMTPTKYPADLKRAAGETNYRSEDTANEAEKNLKANALSPAFQELALWKISSTEATEIAEAKVSKYEVEKYESGKLKQREPYVNDQKQGIAQYWHQNGQKYAEIPWYKNEKHGRFKLYREDGKLEQALSYKNGKPHGLQRWYDSSGVLNNIALYNEGKVVQVDPNLLIKFFTELSSDSN